MLVSLHVRNLALISEEEVNFEDGLNILTGETGAGKSIIIGSIGIALGGKADKSIIRDGADYALIELVFTADTKRQLDRLSEMGFPAEDDGTILIKRKIMPTRSVASVNGEAATGRELKEIAGLLIDVYGQRENQTLLRRGRQLSIIDEYAGGEAQELLRKVREHYTSLHAHEKEWDENDLDEAERRRELELLDFEIDELEKAAVKTGEDDKLEKDYRRMSAVSRLTAACGAARQLTDGESGASELVSRACRELSEVNGDDEALDAIASQLSDIDSLLSDFNRSLDDYTESLTFDPEEFRTVEERLDLINHLKDKYGPTIEDIQKALEKRKQKAEELSDYAAGRKRLEENIKKEKAEFLALCGELSGIRRKAADEFARKMKAELLELNFNQVEFEVSLTENRDSAGETGFDECVFLISMNPGEEKRPLDTIASGGELSRIMLAMKTVFAGKDDIHTFIFDEIDTGISGQTAWKVAGNLGRLAGNHQIICITHLPQIASMEDCHFLIRKDTENGRTYTHITRLSEEESTEELGRLLGGMKVTKAVLENASEMKREAKEAKKM